MTKCDTKGGAGVVTLSSGVRLVPDNHLSPPILVHVALKRSIGDFTGSYTDQGNNA